MVQGTTPTFLFKFSVNLDLINEWRICFAQEGKENLIKTNQDCVIDENQVIYVKLSQDETFAFDDSKYVKIKVKALTNDNNVIPSQTIKMFVCEMLDKVKFDVENTLPQIIDTSTINFEFDTEPCGFGLDFEELYIEQVGTGGGGNITVDSQLSTTSKNPVENRVVAAKFNKLTDELAQKSQTHLNSNFEAMIEELLGAIKHNAIDRYNIGDFFFLAEQNQPDFIFDAPYDLSQIETIKINSVNDITEDMPKMGEAYFVGGCFVVSAIEVGFNPNEYAKQKELKELQDEIANGKVIKEIKQTITSTEDKGINVITVTFADGTTTEFQIRNGSKGSQGLQGLQGLQGEKGADGKDYILTDTDKIDIANLVLSSLPNGDEVSY